MEVGACAGDRLPSQRETQLAAPEHPVGVRKQREREAILQRFAEWRLNPANPGAPNLKNADISALPLSRLSERERAIVRSDATHIVEQIASVAWTAVEVLMAFAKAAVVAQDLTNCLTEVFIEDGLARAQELDDHFKATGMLVGPLHGLPVTIKDHILLKDRDTSTGYTAWAYNTIADKDAVVVDVLRQAGAVFYAKTANPQTLLSLETNNNIYGTTTNPFNRNLSPGGSSGGESALIACCGSPLGVGTDIGGSIRTPAAWCGLYGLKGTSVYLPAMNAEAAMGSVGRLPHAGLLGSHDGMDNIVGSVGPLARSARDLDLFCRVMYTADTPRLEHQVLDIPWRPLADVPLPDKLCIAVLWDDGVVAPHPPIVRALRKVRHALLKAGHEVMDWEPMEHQAHWDLISKLYFLDGGAEYRQTLLDGDERAVPQTEWILSHAPPRAYTAAETWRLNVQREQFRARLLTHWNATAQRTRAGRVVDAVLCPAAATLAPPHGSMRWWGYTSYWNLADYPCVVFPVGRFDPQQEVVDSEDAVPFASDRKPRNNVEAFVQAQWAPETYANAPVSLQLVGRRLGEERLLRTLQVVEACFE